MRSIASTAWRFALALSVLAAVGCHDINSVVPDPAEPGQDVTIFGGGFGATQGTSVVRYDGEELAVVSWSDTAIVATLPDAKADGTYGLEVTVKDDTQAIAHTIDGSPVGMVHVPAGLFRMGSTAGNPEAAPIHWVDLDGFYIDETEVTVAAYQDCVDAGVCTVPSPGYYCNWAVAGREDHPVNCVDWFQAVDFCFWDGKRLPTEAEWEKAARGTDERTYPWGEEAATCEYAVMADLDAGGLGCGASSTAPVGSKPLGDSPYGAQGMAGNVSEWVSDWYDSTYYQVSPLSNPPGPATGTSRVFRAGSWADASGISLSSASRYDAPPTAQGGNIGFRCALDG